MLPHILTGNAELEQLAWRCGSQLKDVSRTSRVTSNGNTAIMLRASAAVFLVYLLTSNLAVSDPIRNQRGEAPKLRQGDASNGGVNSSKQSLSMPILLRANVFRSNLTPFKKLRDKRLASNDPDAESDTNVATLPSLQPGKIAFHRATTRSLNKESIRQVIREALARFNTATRLHTGTADEQEEGDDADDADMSHSDPAVANLPSLQPGKIASFRATTRSLGKESIQKVIREALARFNAATKLHTETADEQEEGDDADDADMSHSDPAVANLPSLQPGKIAYLRATTRSLGKESIRKVIQEALARFNAATRLHTETTDEQEEGDDADMSHGDFISMDEGVNSPETASKDTAPSPTQYKPTRTGPVSTGLSEPLDVTTSHASSTKRYSGNDFPGNSAVAKENQPQNRIGSIASTSLQQRNLTSNINNVISKTQVISQVPVPAFKSSSTFGKNQSLASNLGQKNPGDFRGSLQPWFERQSPNGYPPFQKELGVSSRAKEKNATLKSPLLGDLQSKLAREERLTKARKILTTGQGKPTFERHVGIEALLTSGNVSQNTNGKLGASIGLNSLPKQSLSSSVAPDQSKTKFVHFPLPVGRYRYMGSAASTDYSSDVPTASSSIKSNTELNSGELTKTHANYHKPYHVNSIPLNGFESAYANEHEKAEFEQDRDKEIQSIQSIPGSMIPSRLFGNTQSSANSRLLSANSKETVSTTQKLSLDDLLLVKMKEYLIQIAKNDSSIKLNFDNDFLNQQIVQGESESPDAQANSESSPKLSFPGENVQKIVFNDNRKAPTDLQALLRNGKLWFVGRVSHKGVPIVGRLHGHISPMYQGQQGYKETVKNSESSRRFNDAVNVQAVDTSRLQDPQRQEWLATSVLEPGKAQNTSPVVASSMAEESRGTVNREDDPLHQRNHAETSYADPTGYEGSFTQKQQSIATENFGHQMSSGDTPFLSSTPLQGNTHVNFASTLLANSPGGYDAGLKFVSGKSENTKNAETLIRHQDRDLAQAIKQDFTNPHEPVGQRFQVHDVHVADGASYPSNNVDGGRVYDGEEPTERSNNMAEADSIVRSGKNDAEKNYRIVGEFKPQSNSLEMQENSEPPTSEERYSPNIKASLIESDDSYKARLDYRSGFQQGQENKELREPATEFPRQDDEDESRVSKLSYSQPGGDSGSQQVSGEWQSRIEHEGRGSDKDNTDPENTYVTTGSQEKQVSNEDAVHVEDDRQTHTTGSYPLPYSDFIKNPKEGSGTHEDRETLSASHKSTTSNEGYYSMDDLVKVEIQPSETQVPSSVNVTTKRERRHLIPEINGNEYDEHMGDDAKKGVSTLTGSGERELKSVELDSSDTIQQTFQLRQSRWSRRIEPIVRRSY